MSSDSMNQGSGSTSQPGGSGRGSSSNVPAQAPPLPKTHLLLVQGGAHEAFVGDFLALMELFQNKISPTFAADFWTVYGKKEYFADSDHARYQDIKFGDRIIATRFDAEHRTQSYETIPPTELCIRVFRWIAMKADQNAAHGAKPGDSILIIIIAHGSWNRQASADPTGIRLGHNDLLVPDFVEALRAISKDIQVNVISQACYSAIFAQAIEADKQASRWIQVASQPRLKAFAGERSVSGRWRSSAFFSGMVTSLAGLGKNNLINLETLQNGLKQATETKVKPETILTPYSFTDASLDTQVATLILRKFADFPLTAKNSAARRRLELNVDLMNRPFPSSAVLDDKGHFAASYIENQHAAFGDQDTTTDEGGFEQITRFDDTRKSAAGDILRGMFLRGRYQAAVFNVFMALCLQGACSLKSLEQPVDWYNRGASGTCFPWLSLMLGCFEGLCPDWNAFQEAWGIKESRIWSDYDAPFHWLAVMIGRSFTDLDMVFNVRATHQLGPINGDRLAKLAQPDANWKADANLNIPAQVYGSGTFAFWLPVNVHPKLIDQGFDTAAQELSRAFYLQLGTLERQYRLFFDISEEEMDADVLVAERDVRDWEAEN